MMPVAVTFWRMSSPVQQHVEYAGLIPQLEQLASRIGDRDLLIVESRNAGSDLHVLAVPLVYIYARHVLVLDSPVPPKRAVRGFRDVGQVEIRDGLLSRRRRNRPVDDACDRRADRQHAISGA